MKLIKTNDIKPDHYYLAWFSGIQGRQLTYCLANSNRELEELYSMWLISDNYKVNSVLDDRNAYPLDHHDTLFELTDSEVETHLLMEII